MAWCTAWDALHGVDDPRDRGSRHGSEDLRDGGPGFLPWQLRVPSTDLRADPRTTAARTEAGRASHFNFVKDGVASAIRQAKVAAGGRNVTVVGGASTIQQLLREDLVDELRIDIMPVLLGEGLRLFEHLGSEEPLRLDKIEIDEIGARTSLRFRVGRGRLTKRQDETDG